MKELECTPTVLDAGGQDSSSPFVPFHSVFPLCRRWWSCVTMMMCPISSVRQQIWFAFTKKIIDANLILMQRKSRPR